MFGVCSCVGCDVRIEEFDSFVIPMYSKSSKT
jgi:hypothetical protein